MLLLIQQVLKGYEMNFDEDYYKKTIEHYCYNPLDFAPIDFEFLSIPREVMRAKWLCHSGIEKLGSVKKDFIITTGVGLSGIPHMGTLSQILRVVFLQKNGFNVQMVLGDLDSYNARNKNLQYVVDLSKRYEDFICQLGFDANQGILRNQRDYPEINQRAYLLSKFVSDQDFLDTEEDLSNLYIKEKAYNGITFPVKQAILLMLADFIEISNNYSAIIVMLGLEEHKYVRLARAIVERAEIDFNICSIYSRIIRGLNGYPKMSKSIHGSAISVDMSPAEIRNSILNESDDYDVPENSVIYQMMSAVSDYSSEEIAAIYVECQSRNAFWQLRKKDYAERLVRICANWK